MLILAAFFMQATTPLVDQPEADRPMIRSYEACINGWSDTAESGAMSVDGFQAFVHRECSVQRLSAFHAMDGSMRDEKEAEAGMQRLKALEMGWITRNRSKKAQR